MVRKAPKALPGLKAHRVLKAPSAHRGHRDRKAHRVRLARQVLEPCTSNNRSRSSDTFEDFLNGADLEVTCLPASFSVLLWNATHAIGFSIVGATTQMVDQAGSPLILLDNLSPDDGYFSGIIEFPDLNNYRLDLSIRRLDVTSCELSAAITPLQQ